MNRPLRLAFIGNSLPRRCGIATFTSDLQQAVADCNVETEIVAMTEQGQTYSYPPVVQAQIDDMNPEDYARAAASLNAGSFDVVCLQHEFGIFGGEAGSYIQGLVSKLNVPLVTTLHTILAKPDPIQQRVLSDIAERSAKVVVMAEKGRDLLHSVYRVAPEKIDVIPHGIPDAPFEDPSIAKLKLGFAGRSVILTFGLLSPNKGIEVMIDAMPQILRSRPGTVYVVLGATHPNLVRKQGEAYRESLLARARSRGVADSVVFLDRFVDRATLLDFISMCDVYATPYLNEAQMTSGTLAYSYGMGRAIVSTPYWHAQELLADGRGVLVPFNDHESLAAEIAGLLTDDAKRDAMRRRAYAGSRSMTWQRSAERYVALFRSVRSSGRHMIRAVPATGTPALGGPPPRVRLEHLIAMCDDTGLFQHAVHCLPDRSHGYCVDDNARALLVGIALKPPGDQLMPEALSNRFAAFVQHAWNPASKRFRNFMSFDRRWLEETGSEDSHGRSLWALGECARGDASISRRKWAQSLFREALPVVAEFTSPRAWAFALLGLDGYCEVAPDDVRARELRHQLAERIMAGLTSVETPDWVWFEKGLSYENARLPQALLVTGRATATPAYIAAGLRSLRWLMRQQTTPTGLFRPIGSHGFGEELTPPRPFDQQPVEAAATIAACRAAGRADNDLKWKADALRAFAWFLGSNDLATPLADVETGSCCDGLHPDRINENRGAESLVSFLLALAEIRDLYRADFIRAKPPSLRALVKPPTVPTTSGE